MIRRTPSYSCGQMLATSPPCACHALAWLTPELVKPLATIFVLQRWDDSNGAGFYAGYGLQVKHQLETIGWHGTLTRIPLNEIVPTLPRLWASPLVLEDRQRFQFELVNFQQTGIAQEIKGTRQRQKARGKAKWPRPVIVSADQVEAQPLHWLWEPYIPRGMPVILDGDPGLGKGLMLIQLATNLSRAWPFLDQLGKPTLYADVDGSQTTLILSAEDSLSHVMIPRLKRAKADLTRIKFLTGWLGPEDEERAFDLQHIQVLIHAIEDVKPVLVILDPLVAYLDQRAHSNRNIWFRFKI
jgi:hypothetical protein